MKKTVLTICLTAAVVFTGCIIENPQADPVVSQGITSVVNSNGLEATIQVLDLDNDGFPEGIDIDGDPTELELFFTSLVDVGVYGLDCDGDTLNDLYARVNNDGSFSFRNNSGTSGSLVSMDVNTLGQILCMDINLDGADDVFFIVKLDKATLTPDFFSFEEGDSFENISKTFYLPTEGPNGSVITWTSSNSDVIEVHAPGTYEIPEDVVIDSDDTRISIGTRVLGGSSDNPVDTEKNAQAQVKNDGSADLTAHFSFSPSGNSATTTYSAAATTTPDTPTDLTAVSTGAGIILTWTDNSSDEASFELYRNTRAFGLFAHHATINANETSFLDTVDLVSGKKYFYYIKAKNSVGESSYLGKASATYIYVNNPPVASSVTVSGATVSGGVLTADYTFEDSNNDSELNSVYKWFRIQSGSETEITGASALSYTLTDSDIGFTIVFEVTPVDNQGAAGSSVRSAETSVISPPNAVPVVSSVSLSGETSYGSTLTGVYSYSDTEGDADVSEFLWYSFSDSSGSDEQVISGEVSRNLVTQSVQTGRYIVFAVIPKDSRGGIGSEVRSSYFGPVTDTVSPVPGNSGVITLSATGTTTMDVSWSAASDAVTPVSSLEYRVYRSLSDNMTAGNLADPATHGITVVKEWTSGITSFPDSGLTKGTHYYYTVEVRDGAGNSSLYTASSLVTLEEAGLTITVVSPSDETISFSQVQDASVSTGDTLVVSVSEAFSSFRWTLDGVLLADTDNSVTLSAALYAPGVHHLSVQCVKNEKLYSDTLRFTIRN